MTPHYHDPRSRACRPCHRRVRALGWALDPSTQPDITTAVIAGLLRDLAAHAPQRTVARPPVNDKRKTCNGGTE